MEDYLQIVGLNDDLIFQRKFIAMPRNKSDEMDDVKYADYFALINCPIAQKMKIKH